MVDVVGAVTDVRFPSMRRQVIDALASLGDSQYQQRVWIRQEFPTPTFYDDLTRNVHILYDDCEVLPDPQETIGWVLLPGDEIDRLRALGAVLGPLIDQLGEAPDSAYLADERWPHVMRTATDALRPVVLAGGWADGW